MKLLRELQGNLLYRICEEGMYIKFFVTNKKNPI